MEVEGIDASEALQIISSINKNSEHPLAEAMVIYAKNEGTSFVEVSEFESITGKGVKAKISGGWYSLGMKINA